ncbi:MAG: hypothetical protein R3B90_08430 [Planctomycetaceae bacterium]
MLLIFVYALFIPNDWRRAAIVIGTFSIAPIALIVFAPDQLRVIRVDRRATDRVPVQLVVEMSMMMMLSAVAATLGVATINKLHKGF